MVQEVFVLNAVRDQQRKITVAINNHKVDGISMVIIYFRVIH